MMDGGGNLARTLRQSWFMLKLILLFISFTGKSTITIITTFIDVVKGDTVLPQKLVRKTTLYRFSLADMPHIFASFSRLRTRYIQITYARERARTLFPAFSGRSPWRFFPLTGYTHPEIYRLILIRLLAETGDINESLNARICLWSPEYPTNLYCVEQQRNSWFPGFREISCLK